MITWITRLGLHRRLIRLALAERAARLVTLPLRGEVNGIAKLAFLRSFSISGPANHTIVTNGTDNKSARQPVQARPRLRGAYYALVFLSFAA